jgi:hypothetical protein
MGELSVRRYDTRTKDYHSRGVGSPGGVGHHPHPQPTARPRQAAECFCDAHRLYKPRDRSEVGGIRREQFESISRRASGWLLVIGPNPALASLHKPCMAGLCGRAAGSAQPRCLGDTLGVSTHEPEPVASLALDRSR